jgi:hypothetical protein
MKYLYYSHATKDLFKSVALSIWTEASKILSLNNVLFKLRYNIIS